MTHTQQIEIFLTHHGFGAAKLYPLAGDASFRRYIRVQHAGKSYMLMDAPADKEDVRPFVAIAQYLTHAGYSAPAILAQDVVQGFLLLEDLGDDTFTRILKRSEGVEKERLERQFYEGAIDLLAAWHHAQTHLADPERLPLPLYDEALLMREVALFSDWFLPQCLGLEKAKALRADYLALWQDIIRQTQLATNQLVHRDYHADNLMWLPERSAHARVGLLDFQDAVYGDGAYDMVSLLEDARRDVPAALVQEMKERYVKASCCDGAQFALAYAVLGAQRNSKIVGIFARLAARDGKHHYLDYLPRVWGHLQHDLQHPALAKLRAWIDHHVPAQSRGVISIAFDAHALALSA